MQLLVARFRCRHPVCATKPPAENDHSISTVYEHVGQHLMFDTRSNDHMNLVCSCSENFCFMGAPHAVHHLYNVRQDPQQHHRVQCRRISLADIDNSTNMRAYLKRFVAFGGYRQEEDHSHHLHVHPMLGTEEMQRSYSQHGLPPMSGRMVDRQPGSTWQFAHRPGEDAPIMDSDRDMLGHYGHHNNMTPPPVIGSSIGFHQAAPTFYGQNATAPYFTGWSYGSSATSVNGFAPAPPMAAAHSVASQMYFAPGNNPQMPGGNRAPSPNVRSPVYNKRLLSPLPLIISDAANREVEVNYGHRTPFPANSRGNHARRCAAGWSERIGAGRDVVERIDQDDDPATDFVPGWLRNSAGNLTRKQTVNGSLTFPRKGKNGPRSRMQAAPYTRFREHDSQRRSGLTRRRLFAFEDVIMADTSLLRQDRSQESVPKKNIKNEISDRSSD